MSGDQLDLFSASGNPPEPGSPAVAGRERVSPAGLDDEALIAAIPAASVVDGPALAMEAGRRGLVAAVPVLEALCRRFTGFGVDRAVPEQVTALEALVMIGGGDAARAVARVLALGAVQGPGLKVAVAAAARLDCDLPADTVLALLRHADPGVRADACRCVRGWLQAVPVLLDLLDDLHGHVGTAAACALGRSGRSETRSALVRLLRDAPSPEVIEAIAPIADEECVVLLARIARTMPHLADAALDALEVVDHPRAAQLVPCLTTRRDG
jgi:hypothetical protein